MPGRTKFLLLVIGVVVIFSGIFGVVWYQRESGFRQTKQSAQRVFPDVDITEVTTHNASIAQKPDIPPYYALSGVMRPETGAAYNFEPLLGDGVQPSIFSLDAPSVGHGPMYRAYLGVIQPASLGELGREDQIYLTYYTNFEKGVVMGIIERIEYTKGRTILHLLDDPDSTGYTVSEAMEFTIRDPSQYFDLGDPAAGVNLQAGNIVWGEFSSGVGKSRPTIPLTKLILRAPPYRISRGAISSIEMVSDDAVTFRLDPLPSTVTVNKDTIVYQHESNLPAPGIENWRSRNMGIRALHDGQNVSVFMYLAGDHWQALSIGIRGVAP